MRNILLTIGVIAWGSLFASTSVSDCDSYRSFCLSAATNPSVFDNFKQNLAYTPILEHLGKEEGSRYLDHIVKYSPHLLGDFKKFQENDRLGSPLVFDYPSIGIMGPTTLRYVKVLGDLESLFGNLAGKKIVEIGGGYGGQCLVISKAYNFDRYCIVDLPEPLMLAKKYLDSHNVSNFHCVNSSDLEEQDHCDLVISNYAFSECIRSVQLEYLEKIIKHAKHGYFTLNFLDSATRYGRMTLKELVSILTSYGLNPRTYPEMPPFSPDCVLLVW